MSTHHTIDQRHDYAMEPVKGSRFIGYAAPASCERQALELLKDISVQDKGASHHCWAYLLADGSHRCSDDGEPGGSAGRPILAQLEGHGLVDLMVVVSRWFGGTKLGVGGLIRAYGGCAGKLLDRVEVIEIVQMALLSIRHDFSDTSRVQTVIAQEHIEVRDTEYSDSVTVIAAVPIADVSRIERRFVDSTSGRAKVSASQP